MPTTGDVSVMHNILFSVATTLYEKSGISYMASEKQNIKIYNRTKGHFTQISVYSTTRHNY